MISLRSIDELILLTETKVFCLGQELCPFIYNQAVRLIRNLVILYLYTDIHASLYITEA
jgi:hypothetical protein